MKDEGMMFLLALLLIILLAFSYLGPGFNGLNLTSRGQTKTATEPPGK